MITLPEVETILAQKQQELSAVLAEMQTPEAMADYQRIGKLNATSKDLEEVVNACTDFLDKSKQLSEAQALLEDADFSEFAAADIATLEPAIDALSNKIISLTATKLPDDDKNALLEIRAGTGGAEAALFAEEANRMYLRYLNSQGFKVEQIHTSYEDSGGIKEAIMRVSGHNVYGKLRFESGVHRVQRVPVTESKGRVHTSAISVVVLPEIEPTEVTIPPSDIRVDVYRSSGPGGQSVNTTDSAVRITHIPTGIVVTCQDGKSQIRNREQAMSVLASRLRALQLEQEAQQAKDLRSAAIQSGDRSAKIRTYNFPQGRITDHRITRSWFNVSEAMEGEIADIVDTTNQELRHQLDEANHA